MKKKLEIEKKEKEKRQLETFDDQIKQQMMWSVTGANNDN